MVVETAGGAMSDEERYGLRDEDPAECDIEWLGPSEDDDYQRARGRA